MDAPIGEFKFTRLDKVIFGPGQVARLSAELEQRKLTRALIVTSKTLGRSPLLDQVTKAIGGTLGGIFSATQQHTPSQTVVAAANEAEDIGADCLVSFGGGTPIDTAKAVAMASLHNGASGREIVHIAIPTTLSGAEFTPFAGVTDEASRRKGVLHDPRLMPRVVILDPALTIETPAWLWASTAVRALDHAVEGSYSTRHHLYTDTLATRSIQLLHENLLPSLQAHGSEELVFRSRCQMAAWFAVTCISCGMGLSHAMGHQIGARWDVPHGITSCIMLPHVMRLMAGIAPQRFAPVAEGFGIRFDEKNARLAAIEAADRAERFIGSLSVRTRLSQFEIRRDEIGEIVETVLEEIHHANTIERPITRSEALALLESAY